MNVEFNYKKIYLYLLSVFTLSFFLSLTDVITSSIVNDIRSYSMFGMISCIICWIVIEYFNYKISHTLSIYTDEIDNFDRNILMSQVVLIIILLFRLFLYVL